MLLHLKCTFANHQPYWLNNNSEFHLSLCTGSIIYLFSFTKPTLFNSENLRENILLIILSYPPINSLSCNSRQMFSFAYLPYFLIKMNSFETNNYKRTVFDMFIPKLNSQQTHPTAFHFLSFPLLSLFLLHVHTSLARTQYTLFEHVSSRDDLAKRVGLFSFSQGHLEHSLMDVGVECLAELSELGMTCRPTIDVIWVELQSNQMNWVKSTKLTRVMPWVPSTLSSSFCVITTPWWRETNV